MSKVLIGDAAIEALKQDLDVGIALLQEKRPDAALAHFRGMFARAADHPVVRSTLYTFIGQCHKQAGRPADALEAYTEAVRLQPSNVEAYFHRADVLDDLGRLQEAVDCYEAVLVLNPRHASACIDRGYVLAKMGRNDDAIASYDAAIALDANSAIAWNNRGNVLLGKGDRDEARRSYEAALAIDPRQDNARAQLEALGRAAVPLRIDYPKIAAETAAQDDPFLTSFGVVLDFSAASILALDAFLAETFGSEGEAPDAADYQPSAGKRNLILRFGAYLGETMRRLFGGTWREDPAEPVQPYKTQVAFSAGGGVFPLARVYKRFRDGSAADLFSMLTAVRERLAPEGLPGEAESYFRQADHFVTHGPAHLGATVAAPLYERAVALDASLATRPRAHAIARSVEAPAAPASTPPPRAVAPISLDQVYPGAPAGLALLDPPFARPARTPASFAAAAAVFRAAGLDEIASRFEARVNPGPARR